MTREEQIIEAAEKATYQKPPQYSELVHKSRKVMSAYEVGFIDGCVWADSHPNWISVKDDLPKHDTNENGLVSFPMVLVCLYDGYRDTSYYDDIGEEWGDYDGEVEYWMPLPMPPQGKEE